jgi:hypothetical protein
MFALCNVAGKESRQEDKMEYSCKTNAMKECRDQCCRSCLGKNECNWVCGNDPVKCGQSILINYKREME